MIILIIIILSITNQCGTEASYLTKIITSIEHKRIIFHWINPCDDLVYYTFNSSYEIGRFSSTYMKCNNIFGQTFMRQAHNLPGCKTRHKRSPTILSRIVKTIVSDLVSNVVIDGSRETSRNVSVSMFHENSPFMNIINSIRRTLTRSCHEEYSEEPSDDDVDLIPMDAMAVSKVMGEIVTNTVNLNKIASDCKEGRAATQALGELVGDHELAIIDPYSTTLDHIGISENGKTLIFDFGISKEEEVILIGRLISLISGISTCLMILFIISRYCQIRFKVSQLSNESELTDNPIPLEN